MRESKSSSRNRSKVNNFVNNSTFRVFMNSKDSMNITSVTIEKIKKISNNLGSIKNNNDKNISLTKSRKQVNDGEKMFCTKGCLNVDED